MAGDLTRVVIMWPDFGEHHIARLRAATRHCPDLGITGLATIGGVGRQWQPFGSAALTWALRTARAAAARAGFHVAV